MSCFWRKDTSGSLLAAMNMRVVDWDWRILVPHQWSFQSGLAGKQRHKNKPDQISPRQSTSSLPHTYTLCWLAAIQQHLASTHPNALIYWSLTGGLQQLQVALQANPATVIDKATIRRLSTASIPEKPWLRILWRKIKQFTNHCVDL